MKKKIVILLTATLFCITSCSKEQIVNYEVDEIESSDGIVIGHYLIADKCVAETFALEGMNTTSYEVDIDEDGLCEIVTECVYADDANRVLIYKNVNDEICVGRFVVDYGTLPGYVTEYYDQLSNKFYASDGESIDELDLVDLKYFEFNCSRNQ